MLFAFSLNYMLLQGKLTYLNECQSTHTFSSDCRDNQIHQLQREVGHRRLWYAMRDGEASVVVA